MLLQRVPLQIKSVYSITYMNDTITRLHLKEFRTRSKKKSERLYIGRITPTMTSGPISGIRKQDEINEVP